MEVQQIPLSRILPSQMNPRKTFDQASLQELADNIEKQGLLQPITVRPINEQYEIVCGERRYRACLMLQEKWGDISTVAPDNRFNSILAIVREMTDDEAFDAMITENLQRKDVDPLEEAYAFQELSKKGQSLEELSARFGKSVRFIQERIALNKLNDGLKKMLTDGKIPLVVASIFSKLGEKDQQSVYDKVKKWDRVDKRNAEQILQDLFCKLPMSLWYLEKEPDFDGSCRRSCRKCHLNTANQGCLFHEFSDSAGKDARCIDGEKFSAKTLDYVLYRLSKENLLPLGAEFDGRKVVGIDGRPSYANYDSEEQRVHYRKKIEEAGYRVVDIRSLGGVCYKDDEEKKQLVAENKVVPVIDIFFYYTPGLHQSYYYISEDAKERDQTDMSEGYRVRDLCNRYKFVEEHSGTNHAVAGAIGKHAKFDYSDLSAVEKRMFTSLLMKHCDEVREAFGIGEHAEREEYDQLLAKSANAFDFAIREFIRWMLTKSYDKNVFAHQAGPMLATFGNIWCQEECDKAVAKAEAKKEKELADIRKELNDLGYDTEGNKISWSAEEVNDIPLPATHHLFEQYASMKLKHPDAVLLFRVGDFYESFGEDAEHLAKILGITLTSRKGNDYEFKLAGFPHHALDNYLPKIVRSGKRIAICEATETQTR